MTSDNEDVQNVPSEDSFIDVEVAASQSQRSTRKRRLSLPQPSSKSQKHIDWEAHFDKHADLLNQLFARMDSLDSKIEGVNNSVLEVKNELLLRDVPVNIEHKLDKMLCELEEIKKQKGPSPPTSDILSTQRALEATTSDDMEVVPPADGVDLPEKVAIADVIVEFKEFFQKRKFGYNKYICNKGRYELLNGWKSQDIPFIPAEYLPKEMRYGESEREYEVRRKQKLQDLDAQMELHMIRRDEGLAQYSSVDTHIEQSINDLIIDDIVRGTLKEEYSALIKADEEACQSKWEKVKTNLLEKPQREKEKKIIITNDRVYAKGRATKKAEKKAKENVVPKPTETGSSNKENNPPVGQQKRSKKKNNRNSVPKNTSPTYAYSQQPVLGYQPPSIVVNQQVPFAYHDVNKPPPKLPGVNGAQVLNVGQSPTVQQEAHQHSFPFRWSHPTSRWKYLPQVEI